MTTKKEHEERVGRSGEAFDRRNDQAPHRVTQVILANFPWGMSILLLSSPRA
jgi:hypothetical protein